MASTSFKPCVCGICKEDFENVKMFCQHLQTHDTCNGHNNILCEFHNRSNLHKVEKITCMKCSNKFETISFLHDHICYCFQDESYVYVSKDRLVYPLEELESFVETREDIYEDSVESSPNVPHTDNGIGLEYLVKTVFKQLVKRQAHNTAIEFFDLENKDEIKGKSEETCGAEDGQNEEQTSEKKDEAENMQVTSGMKQDSKQGKSKQKSSVKTKKRKSEDAESSQNTEKIKKLKRTSKTYKKSKINRLYGDSVHDSESILMQKPSKVKKKGKSLTEIVDGSCKSCVNEIQIQNSGGSEETRDEGGVCNDASSCDISETLDKKNNVNQKSSLESDIVDMNQHEETDSLLSEKQNDVISEIVDKSKEKSRKLDKISENCIQKTEKRGRKKGSSFETCSICGITIAKCKMKNHTISHSDERPHKCELCPKTYKYRSHLDYHMQTHGSTLSYYCEICGQGFLMEDRLKRHLFSHTDYRPFPCNICGAGFINRSRLNRHMNLHTGKKKEQCDRCGMRFMNKNNLNTHVSRVHKRERRFACVECDKTFITNYELKCHLMSHSGVRPYKCNMCKADFIQRKELRRHMLKQHKTHLDNKTIPEFPTTSLQSDNNNVDIQEERIIKVELIQEDTYENGGYQIKHLVPDEKDQSSVVTEQIQNDSTSVTLNLCQYDSTSYNTHIAGVDSTVLNDGSTNSLIARDNSQGIDFQPYRRTIQ